MPSKRQKKRKRKQAMMEGKAASLSSNRKKGNKFCEKLSKNDVANDSSAVAKDHSLAFSWLKDTKAVRSHLDDNINLFDKLEKSDGLIRIENFLPQHVAEFALDCVRQIPEEEWGIREIDQKMSQENEATTQHKFFVKNVYPPASRNTKGKVRSEKSKQIKEALDMIVKVVRDIWPGKRSVFSVSV